MISIKNPARSRPLSANVKRLMKMARESPQNPDVEKIEREFTARDLAYCDMQGNIFMAAIDQDVPMDDFAPIFMNSQLAGVIDSGPDRRQLDQHLAAVLPRFHHFTHLFQMARRPRKAVEHLFGVDVRVAVGMLDHGPVFQNVGVFFVFHGEVLSFTGRI